MKKKYLPQINITANKILDKNMIIFFANEKDRNVIKMFPELKKLKPEDKSKFISKYINNFYKNSKSKIKQKISYLETKRNKLRSICFVLAEITDCDWQGYKKITIYPGLCPIAPRFLRAGSFMVPLYCQDKYLLKLCAHELTHFIYFKKWQQIFKDSYKTYEYPHPTWVLSEILVAVIINDKRVRNVTKMKEGLYTSWKKIDKKYKLYAIFNQIYKNSNNFSEFLMRAKNKYSKLDIKYKLTKQLT